MSGAYRYTNRDISLSLYLLYLLYTYIYIYIIYTFGSTFKSEVPFIPRWHVARGMARDMPLENEYIKHETCHTEVAWHIAYVTCNLLTIPKIDLPVIISAVIIIIIIIF